MSDDQLFLSSLHVALTKHSRDIQRMGIFADVKALLARPVVAPSPAPTGKARHVGAAEKPVTEAELQAALERMSAERLAAYETIAAAGSRREQLLMDENSDDLIAALAREVDGASLLLERLDRLEPDARNRLLELQDERRRGRWLELRDSYIAAGRRHVEALRRTALDRSDADAAWRAVTAEFPGAADILPAFIFLPSRAADELDAELARFSMMAFNPRPDPALPFSLGARMKRAGFDAVSEAGRWGSASVMGAVATVTVQVLTPRLGADGKWLKVNDVIQLTGAEAECEIAAGRAKIVNQEFA